MITPEIMGIQPATSDLVSVPQQIDDQTAYGIEVVFSGGAGDLVGTLTLECANGPASGSGNPTVWITVAGSAQAVTASTNHYWNVEDASYRWFRATWTYTSGTGNISMNAVIKQPSNRY